HREGIFCEGLRGDKLVDPLMVWGAAAQFDLTGWSSKRVDSGIPRVAGGGESPSRSFLWPGTGPAKTISLDGLPRLLFDDSPFDLRGRADLDLRLPLAFGPNVDHRLQLKLIDGCKILTRHDAPGLPAVEARLASDRSHFLQSNTDGLL